VWVDIQVSLDAAPIPQPEPVAVQEPVVIDTTLSQPPTVDLSSPFPQTPTDQLELEFEHMTISTPLSQLIGSEPMVPVVVAQPIIELPTPGTPEPVPIVVEEPVQPVVVDHVAQWNYMSPQEAESIQTLRDMGFSGDLLTILRSKKGDLVEVVREILGN